MYVGFSVFFLMEVFLFFSLRPSQIREAFTYGSAGGEEMEREREKDNEDGREIKGSRKKKTGGKGRKQRSRKGKKKRGGRGKNGRSAGRVR